MVNHLYSQLQSILQVTIYPLRIYDKNTTSVARAIRQLQAQNRDKFSQVFINITSDNSSEFAAFSDFDKLGIAIYIEILKY